MKRILMNAYCKTNLGDDLFVKILCARYPEHRFYLSCSRYDDRAFEEIPNLTIMNRTHLKGMLIQNFKRLLGKLGIQTNFPYDAQVFIGGSIFIEEKDEGKEVPYSQALYKQKITPNIPYFIIGANFGPYDSEAFVQLHREYFEKNVDDLCMRDLESYNLFRDIKKVRYAPDVVFNYRLPACKKEDLILISCIFNDGRIDFHDKFDNDAYEKKMVELCRYYLSLGKKICLLAMCNHQQDFVMCRKIQSHFKEGVFVEEYTGDIEKTIKLIASAEYVIASRFHAMILGWLANTPVFPIAYNNKTMNAVTTYHFQGNYTTIEEFSQLSMEEIDRNRTNQYIFDTEPLKMEAQKQFDGLDRFLHHDRLR